jgi:hypothetical protein
MSVYDLYRSSTTRADSRGMNQEERGNLHLKEPKTDFALGFIVDFGLGGICALALGAGGNWG